MEPLTKISLKNIKPHIADAIKESCYRIDARLYNIANNVHNILTTSVEPGVEIAKDLSKIIDKTIKESIDLGCDLSVIVKGILIGTFRASPFIHQEAHKTIRILIEEILQPVFKYKGDIKQMVEGVLAGIVVIAREFKLNTQEALVVAKEDILSSAKAKDPKFADDIKEILPSLDDAR
jgi:hypothetical protein